MIDSSMILKATFEKIIESINIGIFDLLHTGVALFCDKGFFIYCNKSFLKMYNLPESVIGKHITDYFLTGERGVMSSIRTRKMVICSSQTILFRMSRVSCGGWWSKASLPISTRISCWPCWIRFAIWK